MINLKKSLFLFTLLSLASLTGCQSLPQSTSSPTSQGYDSPIPVHVSGFTGLRF